MSEPGEATPEEQRLLAEAIKTLAVLTVRRGFGVSNLLCGIPLETGGAIAVRCVVVIGAQAAQALDEAVQRLTAEGKFSAQVRAPGFPRNMPGGGPLQ